MIQVKGRVDYTQGPSQEFVAGPWEFSQFEQYAARKGFTAETAPLTATLYLAYAATHRSEWPPTEGFEVWSQNVSNLDTDETEVRPTEAATLAGS